MILGRESITFTLAVFLWLVGLFVLFVGIGLAGLFLIRRDLRKADDLFQSFWLGWAFAVFLMQAIHLILPIDGRVLVGLCAISLAGLVLYAVQLWNIACGVTRRELGLWALVLLLALLMANRALAPVVTYDDTGVYHMSSTVWNSTYPIVKGLGNLHGRLAFNNSHFLYTALLELGPWVGRSYMVANRLLVTVLLSQAVLSSGGAIVGPRPAYTPSLLLTLMLAPIITLAMAPDVAGLSTDIALAVLGIVLLWNLTRLATVPRGHTRELRFQLFAIAALGTLGITVKLSFVVFAAVSCLVAGGIWYRKSARELTWSEARRAFMPAVVVGALGLGTWMIRGMILSGYIAYPSTLGALPVPWRVPRPLALSEANWIQSWARLPGVPWVDVLGNSDWIGPWVTALPGYVATALFVTGAALAVWLARYVQRHRYDEQSLSPMWALLLPPAAGAVFWFITAPAARFAGSTFWLMATASVLLALDSETFAHRATEHRVRAGVAVAMLIVAWQPLPTLLISLPATGTLPPIPMPALDSLQTEEGQLINVTARGEARCWHAALPCTPYFRPNLRLFAPGDLSQGFYLDDTVTYADFQVPPLTSVTGPADLGVAPATWPVAQHLPARIRDANSHLRFLLYTDRAGPINVTLTFAPASFAPPTDNPRVELWLNGQYVGIVREQDEPVSVGLDLSDEFNMLTLRPLDRPLQFQGTTMGIPNQDSEPSAPTTLLGIDFVRPEVDQRD